MDDFLFKYLKDNGILYAHIDKDHNLIEFNESFKQAVDYLYGVDIKIGGNTLDYMTYNGDDEKITRNAERCLLYGEVTKIRNFYGGINSNAQCYESTYYPVIDECGVIIGAKVFSHNITEVKLLEEKIELIYQDNKVLENNIKLIHILSENLLAKMVKLSDDVTIEICDETIISEINKIKIDLNILQKYSNI